MVRQNHKVNGRKKTARERILETARRVMTTKGFSKCTMNDLAKEAGLTEPTLYQYFKGKEDILFSAVLDRDVDAYSFYNEQVGGIKGAYNQLRKLIWAHLRWNDQHQEAVILSFLGCRSNERFYTSHSYEGVKEYCRMFKGVLSEAVKEGTLRSDVNLTLARDIILGLLDFEGYTVAITGEIEESAADHEDIMKLLDRMLLKGEERIPSKKEKVLQAATELFARKGFAKATISDIALQANVSDGSVYEYFDNKEDLLMSIPEEGFKRHLEDLKDTCETARNVRRLRRFIQDHFRLYLENRDFLIVYLRLIQLNRRFTKSRAYQTLRVYTDALETIVQEGITRGSFHKDCNVRVFRNMFWGAFTYLGLRWFVVRGNSNVDKFREIGEFTKLMLDSIEIPAPSLYASQPLAS